MSFEFLRPDYMVVRRMPKSRRDKETFATFVLKWQENRDWQPESVIFRIDPVGLYKSLTGLTDLSRQFTVVAMLNGALASGRPVLIQHGKSINLREFSAPVSIPEDAVDSHFRDFLWLVGFSIGTGEWPVLLQLLRQKRKSEGPISPALLAELGQRCRHLGHL